MGAGECVRRRRAVRVPIRCLLCVRVPVPLNCRAPYAVCQCLGVPRARGRHARVRGVCEQPPPLAPMPSVSPLVRAARYSVDGRCPDLYPVARRPRAPVVVHVGARGQNTLRLPLRAGRDGSGGDCSGLGWTAGWTATERGHDPGAGHDSRHPTDTSHDTPDVRSWLWLSRSTDDAITSVSRPSSVVPYSFT